MAKRKILTAGILVGAGWLAMRTWSAKRSVEMFEYSVSDIALRFSGITPVLSFKLNIFNPNEQPVPIRDVVGEVVFKGTKVASFQNTNPAKIGARQKSFIDMQVRLQAGPLLAAIIKKQPGLTVDLTGLMRTAFFDMPFNYSYQPSKI